MINNKEKESFNVSSPNRIEETTKFKGDITSKGDFRIDGVLTGNIITSGKVIIGKNGSVKGNIECSFIEVEGSFDGNLIASNMLLLRASSKLKGDVIVEKLSVESDAIFNAKCTMKKKEEIQNMLKQNKNTIHSGEKRA